MDQELGVPSLYQHHRSKIPCCTGKSSLNLLTSAKTEGLTPRPLHGHLNSQSLPKNCESQIYQDTLRLSPMMQGCSSKHFTAASRGTGDLMIPRSSSRHHPPLERMTDSNSPVPLPLLLCNVWLMTCLEIKFASPLSREAAPKLSL